MTKVKQKVAVFDIDGTIFRSSLLIEVTEALIQEGIFNQKAKDIYKKAYLDWVNRKDSYEKYILGVVESFRMNIKGVNHLDFLRIAEKAVSFHRDRVYRFTRDLVYDLKKKKYFILAISHSPKEILDMFCRGLGFDKVYGSIYEVGSDAKYTSEILFEDAISDKANILKRAVEKENLTLKGSIGVGDTESDIPLLKMVDKPICFNPNEKLYRHACRAGWEIVVERKDVIYKLS